VGSSIRGRGARDIPCVVQQEAGLFRADRRQSVLGAACVTMNELPLEPPNPVFSRGPRRHRVTQRKGLEETDINAEEHQFPASELDRGCR